MLIVDTLILIGIFVFGALFGVVTMAMAQAAKNADLEMRLDPGEKEDDE